MSLSSEFQAALIDGNAKLCGELWAHQFPNMPRPVSLGEREATMHVARTAADSVPLAKRLYSHAWLEERAMRSSLPDELRPEPTGPVIVPSVGISVNTSSKSADRIEEAKYIEGVMAAAAEDAMLSGITDPARVSRIMWDARAKSLGQPRKKSKLRRA